MVFPILPANTLSGGYDIENSCRFDEASDASLGGTFGTPTEAKAFTLSMWFKRAGMMGTIQALLGCGPYEAIIIQDEKMGIFWDNVSAGRINWAPLLRDHSAWYHFVIAQDTAQGTDTNRVKFYLNGTQITTLGGYTSWPAQNLVGGFNEDGQAFYISTYDGTGWAAGGYCADVAFIDGLQYAASNFGETDEDSGIWKPKEFKDDVTFGDNGFYLEFKQSGTGTDASGLGADTSGNDNHLALSNLAATDQSTDTPMNNFCTWNPLDEATNGLVYSEGNTKARPASGNNHLRSNPTVFASSGKWYAEFIVTSGYISDSVLIGVIKSSAIHRASNNDALWYTQDGAIGYDVGGTLKVNTSTYSSSGTTWTTNDVMSVALDMDNNKLYLGKNGTWFNSANFSNGTGYVYNAGVLADGSWGFSFNGYGSSGGNETTWVANFGNPPYAISSGNADANGYGNFEYAVPSGYFALCTKNLAKYGG